MKPTAWIIFLIVVALSRSSRAAENGGELWWPQFRGPNSSGLGGGNPPVHFGPGQNVQWKTPVGSGLSSPIIWAERVFLTEFDQANQKLATVCMIAARATSYGGARSPWRKSKTSTKSAARLVPRLPRTESGSMFTSALAGCCVTTWTEI